MAVNVETLEKLERRITLSLPSAQISSEVESRLRKLSRTVKAAGFRPGKVPMSVVAQRYGYSVHYEVVNDHVGRAFSDAATEAKLRVAGAPRIEQKDDTQDGRIVFDATFEVYPEVQIGDLSAAEIESASAEVTEQAIDRTIGILRKQRRTFGQRPAADAAQEGDRVTIDFEGKIDGEPFAGGKADAFQFIIGEGQMLEQFDKAVRGMKVGESKTFALQFPSDYHGQDVAGKEADFRVTVTRIEAQKLPDADEAFAKTLGIAEASVQGLRDSVASNLQREVRVRVLARNKAAVMDALVAQSALELPKALVNSEVERLIASAREDLKRRGIKDADKAPLPQELFQAQAERRVRLGLVVAELVRANNLQAKPEQLQAHIEEMSQSYEKPSEVVRWYLSDRNRMAEVEALVVEKNVTDFVLSQAKVTPKVLAFDDLMNA
ncbi:MAG TPA: trigger factor [Rubrivivax sp.]|nr:trigger factor [Rubrivivax sp.]